MAAHALRSEGFLAEVSNPLCAANWLVVARGQIRPASCDLQRVRIRFDELAANFRGEFNGLGIPSRRDFH
jgi:hypothetical protein